MQEFLIATMRNSILTPCGLSNKRLVTENKYAINDIMDLWMKLKHTLIASQLWIQPIRFCLFYGFLGIFSSQCRGLPLAKQKINKSHFIVFFKLTGNQL